MELLPASVEGSLLPDLKLSLIDEAIVEEDTLAVARRAQEADQSVVLFERVFSLNAIAEEGCTTMGLGQSNFASVIELSNICLMVESNGASATRRTLQEDQENNLSSSTTSWAGATVSMKMCVSFIDEYCYQTPLARVDKKPTTTTPAPTMQI